jgi:CRP/FNR family transcriptional regulator
MHEATTHDLQVAHEQVTLIGRRTAEERVACFLLSMRARWAHVQGLSITVELPMSRTDMADYLGLTIETVSRTISRMARSRVLLVVPDAVRILDLPRLQAMAGGESGE